jgi:hypothetical protein
LPLDLDSNSPRFEDREDGQADPKDLTIPFKHDQVPHAYGGFERDLMQEQGGEIRRGDPDVDGLAIGINLGKEVCLKIVEYLSREILRGALAGAHQDMYPELGLDLLGSKLRPLRLSRNRMLGDKVDPGDFGGR